MLIDASSDALTRAAAGAVELLSFFSQEQRLLTLETALPSASLVVERARVREAVNEPFRLEIDALSGSQQLDLQALLGAQISLRLHAPDGGLRPWHGYVFEAGQLGSDGGLARYRLVMRPWLSFMALRRDSFVFQDQTALDIVARVAKDCPGMHLRFDVSETLRVRSLCVQYRESGLDFITRLLAEEGLSYHFEHLEGDAAREADRQGHARHVMVITDRASERPSLGALRFAKPDVNGIAEAIEHVADRRRVQANAVALGSWDHKRLAGPSAALSSALPQGEVPALEDYDGQGAYRYENGAHAERAAALRLAAHELALQGIEGDARASRLEAGKRFELVDHPSYGANTTALTYAGQALAGQSAKAKANAFTLMVVELEAANNLGAQAARLLRAPDLDQGTYRTRFEAVPAAAPIVPAWRPKPTAPGVQTALVVGLAGEALTTDRDLRVKVQFHWQRGEAPNAGGLPASAPSEPRGNAPGTDASGTWVRVAQPAAGANWGASFTPRIGTEVLVDHVDGDIDRPVIVAQLHNGSDALPWPGGIDSGSNHPATIAGWLSEALDGAGLNQWLIDDASGQLRMRLASDGGSSSPWSELSLGHLIAQGERSAQRGAWLGSGFYAHTDGWATLRAAGGLLLTTSARGGTYGSAEGSAMDTAEVRAQLRSAQQLGQALGGAARGQGALGLASAVDGQALERLIAALEAPAQGSGSGTDPCSAASASSAAERFAEPLVVLDSASALAMTSPAAIAGFAGQGLSLTAQGDMHLAAAHTASLASGSTTSLYTHAGSLQAIAAHGELSLRAHTDTLELLADQAVSVTSTNGQIRVQAASRIELVGGSSKLVLDGDSIEFTTPGSFKVQASNHAWQGPGGQVAEMPVLPQGGETTRNWIEIDHRDEDALAMAGQRYKIFFEGGLVQAGQLDAQGHARHENVPARATKVEYEARMPEKDAAWDPLSSLVSAANSKLG